jgi:hypothetical protein
MTAASVVYSGYPLVEPAVHACVSEAAFSSRTKGAGRLRGVVHLLFLLACAFKHRSLSMNAHTLRMQRCIYISFLWGFLDVGKDTVLP